MPPRISYIYVATPPTKTVYYAGECFDPAGMIVKAHYSDNTESIIYVFSFSPQTPLTTSDTNITVSYNLFSTTTPITVNGPVVVPFPTQNLSQSNIGSNPFYNLFDQSIRFITNSISVNRDSYTLSFNLIYHSRMMDRLSDLVYGLPYRFKTNYHQYLIDDGLDVSSHNIYKYIDGEGYIHTFTYAYDNFYYCNQSRLYLTFYTESNITYGKIIDENGNELHFDSDGRLIKIVSSTGQNNIKHIVYNGNYIDYVYDERFNTTKIAFIYSNSNQLNEVRFIYKNNLIKKLSFSYTNNFLTSIIEYDASSNYRTLYTYYYNYDGSNSSYDHLEYIKDHLNNVAYKFHYVYDSNYVDYVVDYLQTGLFNTGSFIIKDSITRTSYSILLDKSTNEIVIKNHNNLYFTYHLDNKALITASFESDQNGGNLKTLYKETGDYIDINGDLSSSGVNTHYAKNITSPLSIPLSSDVVAHLNDYKHFVLRLYIKIKSTGVKRVKTILSANGISSSVTDLNVDQYNKYQLIEIPFTRDSNSLTNVTLSLSFKDEDDNNANVDITDLYIDKKERTVLKFYNGSNSFDELVSVNLFGASPYTPRETINNSSYPYFTEEDLLHTLRFNLLSYRYFSLSQLIIFFSHGNKTSYYKSAFNGVNQNNVGIFNSIILMTNNVGDTNSWFFLTKSADDRIETKTYYHFITSNNTSYLDIIKRTIIDNDASTLKEVIERYELYNNRLVGVTCSHLLDDNTFYNETNYSYFNNGELESVVMIGGNETITLYQATQNNDGYVNQKSNGIYAINVSYSDYLENSFYRTKYENDEYNVYSKNMIYDSYKDELIGVAHLVNQVNKATNGLSIDYSNNEVNYILNNGPYYKLSNNALTDLSTLKRHNGSSFKDILSIKATPLLNEVTYFGPTSSSNKVITHDYDVYGKLIDEKRNSVTKVTFNYDTSGIESLTVLKTLISVDDDYIDKTTTYSFNNYDSYEVSFLDDYFVIKRLYTGFLEYAIGGESYTCKSIDDKLDFCVYHDNRLENLSIKRAYDRFDRLIERRRFNNNNLSNCFLKDIITYQTSSMLSSGFKQKNEDTDLVDESYGYDECGNLDYVALLYRDAADQNASPNLSIKSFQYDGFNRLVYEDSDSMANRSYHYDSYGRMDYFGSNQLTYNNEGQLTSFGSITFGYNKYGSRNRKTVNNEDIYYFWLNSKLLIEITTGITFTYDYRGIRHTKDTNKETITYFYDGNKLIGEDHIGKNTNPSFKLRFFYDNDGTPLGLRYIYLVNNEEQAKDYIYIVNPFKEIVGISYYSGNSSSTACSLEAIYIYDAWGNHNVMTASGVIDTDDDSIGNINPLRYKGYYYDKESGLYYLLSRYYDPSIGQFITPDDYTYLDINKVSGYHLYAYCNNNPICDEGGSVLIDKFLKNKINMNWANSVNEAASPLSPYQGWFCSFFKTERPSFFVFSSNEVILASWDLKTLKLGYAFEDSFKSQIYNSSGNISVFLGYEINKERCGIFVGTSLGQIAYENRFVTISFDFLTAKFYAGYHEGKWVLDFGFGWFDIGISINFGEIIKSFVEWITGGE